MRKPRRDVILRRFLAGESIGRLVYLLDVSRTHVEQVIRDALNRSTK